jgi:hypothetical protein
MPLYFFDFRDGHQQAFDDQGQELPDFSKASSEVTNNLLDAARDVKPAGGQQECAPQGSIGDEKVFLRSRLSLFPEWSI